MEDTDSTEMRQFTITLGGIPNVRPTHVRTLEGHLDDVVDAEEMNATVAVSRSDRGIDGEYKSLVVDLWIENDDDLGDHSGLLITAVNDWVETEVEA